MDISNYIEYQKREYCNALPCKVQVLLNQQAQEFLRLHRR